MVYSLKFPANSKDGMRYEVYKTDITASKLFLSEFAKKDIDETSIFLELTNNTVFSSINLSKCTSSEQTTLLILGERNENK